MRRSKGVHNRATSTVTLGNELWLYRYHAARSGADCDRTSSDFLVQIPAAINENVLSTIRNGDFRLGLRISSGVVFSADHSGKADRIGGGSCDRFSRRRCESRIITFLMDWTIDAFAFFMKG